MTHMVYVLDGDPLPLARGRIGGRYAKHHIYDPQRNIKLVVGIKLNAQHNNQPPITGPVALEAHFYFPIPKQNKYKVKALQFHKSVPDLSNLTKFIEDCCQDVGIIHNDCLIARTIVDKRYDTKPRTEFWFSSLE